MSSQQESSSSESLKNKSMAASHSSNASSQQEATSSNQLIQIQNKENMADSASSSTGLQQPEKTSSPKLTEKLSYLETLLGPNGPQECQIAMLSLLDKTDIAALRATSKTIKSNALLTKVDENPYHRNLLLGFCQYQRGCERSSSRELTECNASHRDECIVKPCETHPGSRVFPVCEGEVDLADYGLWMLAEPDFWSRIDFNLCAGCEDKLWAKPIPAEGDYCECISDFESLEVHDAAVLAGTEPWSCRLCARYAFSKKQAIAWGYRCESCFPSFEQFEKDIREPLVPDDNDLFDEDHPACLVMFNPYVQTLEPEPPCSEKHKPLVDLLGKADFLVFPQCGQCQKIIERKRLLEFKVVLEEFGRHGVVSLCRMAWSREQCARSVWQRCRWCTKLKREGDPRRWFNGQKAAEAMRKKAIKWSKEKDGVWSYLLKKMF